MTRLRHRALARLILQPLVSWLVWSVENATREGFKNKFNLLFTNLTALVIDTGSTENSTHQNI